MNVKGRERIVVLSLLLIVVIILVGVGVVFTRLAILNVSSPTTTSTTQISSSDTQHAWIATAPQVNAIQSNGPLEVVIGYVDPLTQYQGDTWNCWWLFLSTMNTNTYTAIDRCSDHVAIPQNGLTVGASAERTTSQDKNPLAYGSGIPYGITFAFINCASTDVTITNARIAFSSQNVRWYSQSSKPQAIHYGAANENINIAVGKFIGDNNQLTYGLYGIDSSYVQDGTPNSRGLWVKYGMLASYGQFYSLPQYEITSDFQLPEGSIGKVLYTFSYSLGSQSFTLSGSIPFSVTSQSSANSVFQNQHSIRSSIIADCPLSSTQQTTTTALPPNTPTYYTALGSDCVASTLFHDAVLEIHIVTSDGKYIYGGITTQIDEYAFGQIHLPILTFTLGGRTYSSGGTINYNGICVQAPSSLWWVDKLTVSVAGYPSVTFNWTPTSGEHSIIEVVYPQAQIVVKQGNPQITSS